MCVYCKEDSDFSLKHFNKKFATKFRQLLSSWLSNQINLFHTLSWITFGNKFTIMVSRRFLSSWNCGHIMTKWTSSPRTCVPRDRQYLQCLSDLGVLFLPNRPVSISRLCALIRNFEKHCLFLKSFITSNYVLKLKTNCICA